MVNLVGGGKGLLVLVLEEVVDEVPAGPVLRSEPDVLCYRVKDVHAAE